MIQHIDLETVLKRTVSELYRDLVTRATGHAVRRGIEEALTGREVGLTVIDFSRVGLVDHSCADEIVAKLLLRAAPRRARHGAFVFRGLSEAHREAIEPVLERHRLAMIVEEGGRLELLGPVAAAPRRAFRALADGACDLMDVARRAGLTLDEAGRAFEELAARRLVPPPYAA